MAAVDRVSADRRLWMTMPVVTLKRLSRNDQ